MQAEQWARAKAIFHDAVSMAEEDARAYVHKACSDDAEVEAIVVDLLANQTGDDGESPGETPLFTAGQLVGERYEIVRYIACGGMGQVYEANDRLPSHSRRSDAEGKCPSVFDREVRVARKVLTKTCVLCSITSYTLRRTAPRFHV